MLDGLEFGSCVVLPVACNARHWGRDHRMPCRECL